MKVSAFLHELYEYDLLASGKIDIIVVSEGGNVKSLRSEMLYRVASSIGWPISVLELDKLAESSDLDNVFMEEYGHLGVPCLLIYGFETGFEYAMDYDQGMKWLLSCTHDYMMLGGVNLSLAFKERARLEEMEALYLEKMTIGFDRLDYNDEDDYDDEDQQSIMDLIEDYREDDWNPHISDILKEWSDLKKEFENICGRYPSAQEAIHLMDQVSVFDKTFTWLIGSFYKPGNNSISESVKAETKKRKELLSAKIDMLAGNKRNEIDVSSDTPDPTVVCSDELPF